MDKKFKQFDFENLSIVKGLMNKDDFEKDIVYLRGTILNGTITIERKMDEFLSSYFCANNDKKNELCELLLFTERITFDVKRQVLQVIINNHYKDFLKEYPDFLTLLESLIPHRNVFAHLEADKSGSILEGENQNIVFKKYKGGKIKPEVYSLEKIGKTSEILVALDFYFEFLLKAMPPLV